MPAPDPLARLKIEAAAEVQQIYADLAARPLERNCTLRTECCQFHLTGKIPQLTRGEALVAAKALRATGRKTLPDSTDGTCPLLDPKTSRCLIYKSRPFGCRTHFCAAAGSTSSAASKKSTPASTATAHIQLTTPLITPSRIFEAHPKSLCQPCPRKKNRMRS